MGYIDNNLLSDEQILFRTKKHIIIFFFPIVWAIFSVFAIIYMRNNLILAKLTWIPLLVTLFYWGYVSLDYVTSDFAVTNKRILMREGFFYRHTNETRLSAIARVNVDQSLLGQWLCYGMVSINAFGAFDVFPMVAYPIKFQKSVNEELYKLLK
jgi:uncharacterized membrane protein YdbT with pleckstrin-like domain